MTHKKKCSVSFLLENSILICGFIVSGVDRTSKIFKKLRFCINNLSAISKDFDLGIVDPNNF